ncbi:MAG: 50S ribosomal protein L22 [Peptococcaceae bacterium]|nr:50S ribosomal protein L22 [Peptococcaceae bacterium]
MEARAIAKYIRIAPRKVRQVADLVRGKSVDEALDILRFTPKKAAVPIAKVIRSAAANGEHNYEMDRDEMRIARIFVDEGPTLKRWRARAYGRANLRRRRTSHITVIVSDGKEG